MNLRPENGAKNRPTTVPRAQKARGLSRWIPLSLFLGALLAGAMAVPTETVAVAKGRRYCPKNMVNIRGKYCIDRYEAYTAEMLKGGKLRRHTFSKPVDNKKVKALNRKGRMPQGYISRNQAASACKNAGKRLCTGTEWVKACKGKKPTTYPYGKKRKPGRCNDKGISSFNLYFGANGQEAPKASYTFANLNDPRLNKPKGTCAPSGRHKKCKNSYKTYDMVGNLHEWTSEASGTFRGGYFLDVEKNGDGCEYKTTAHNPKYHDYSTGFRCCKSLR